MHDGNPVNIHTGMYPRGIDVSNFKWKFEYLVPEERFSGGGVQIWRPFVSYLYVWYTYLRETNKLSEIQICGKTGVNREKGGPQYTYLWGKQLVKFNFVGKEGTTRKRGVQTSSACDFLCYVFVHLFVSENPWYPYYFLFEEPSFQRIEQKTGQIKDTLEVFRTIFWKFLISSHCSLHKFELFYYTETTQRCLWFECFALQKTTK